MVTGKRALIVDDSRSARVILSRMLEHHGMAVDTAESAEQALEFLAQSRPDVIFMDHLMPGMDGFQAVQVIKSDPQTATIPLMMYTSQEGELYVSQARALGRGGRAAEDCPSGRRLARALSAPPAAGPAPAPLGPVRRRRGALASGRCRGGCKQRFRGRRAAGRADQPGPARIGDALARARGAAG